MNPIAADPVALAAALIRCESVTPHDAGALSVAGAALAEIGFQLEEHVLGAEAGRPPIRNLIAWRGQGRPVVAFAGHTDVVPAGEATRWQSDPFGAVVREGHLIGRGAVDMKGGVAAAIAAAARLPTDHPGTLLFILTGDEEGPAEDGTRRLVPLLAARGLTPDACLVGEPTSLATLGDVIKIGRRGSLTGHLTVEGVQGHVAYPERAANPIHRLLPLLQALLAPLDQGMEGFQASSLQITTVDVGNPATNVIPGLAQAWFNIRFCPLWSCASLEGELRARLSAVAPSGWQLQALHGAEPFLTQPGRWADLVAEALHEVTGQMPQRTTGGGTSDARFLAPVAPTLEAGLVGATMHQVDEAVSLADLEAMTKAYGLIFSRGLTTLAQEEAS